MVLSIWGGSSIDMVARSAYRQGPSQPGPVHRARGRRFPGTVRGRPPGAARPRSHDSRPFMCAEPPGCPTRAMAPAGGGSGRARGALVGLDAVAAQQLGEPVDLPGQPDDLLVQASMSAIRPSLEGLVV